MNSHHKLHIILPALILIFTLSFLCMKLFKPILKQSIKEDNLYFNEYTQIIPHFIKSEAQIDGKPLEFILLPHNDVYIIPKQAAKKADVLISYGINTDNAFEEVFAEYFDKHVYGYDCAITKIRNDHPKTHYAYECIGTDKFVLKKDKSSGLTHKFKDVLKRNNLLDKKIFLKVDIAGAEVEVYKQFLEFSDNLTAIELAIHIENIEQIRETRKMINEIEKDFILVRRHTHPVHAILYDRFLIKNINGIVSPTMILSYVNKNLVDDYKISSNQHSSYPRWNYFAEEYSQEKYPTDIDLYRVWPTVIYKTVEKFFTFDLPRKMNII